VGCRYFGAATAQVGDHAADVEAQGRDLYPDRDLAFAAPGLGAVVDLGIAAQRWRPNLGATDPDIVGGLFEQLLSVTLLGRPMI